MQAQTLERHDQGGVRVDLCFECAGIWFDHLASMQLAPSAVIELFKEIYARRAGTHQSPIDRMGCPRCQRTLVPSFDLSKTGRFSYFRCPQGDGRFTPFFQFLREKQFIRSLTEVELQRVRSQVRQITCSGCGAPIDLQHDSQCKYCHAPVSFLDPDAVENAVKMWSEAESRRHMSPTQEELGNTLQHMQLTHTGQSSASGARLGDRILLAGIDDDTAESVGLDLVNLGIHAVGRLFANSR
jgi:hypothetical protein